MLKLMQFSITLILLITGCGMTKEGGLFDSGYDIKKQSDGAGLFLDTPRMWRDWMLSVDSEIPKETRSRNGTAQHDPLQGRPNGGGTWDAYWLKRIRSVQDGHSEHPQKYVNYIIEQRRHAGLPELVGYP